MTRPVTPTSRSTGPSGRTLVFDRAAIQAVDREAIERYGIPGVVLMENASLGLAREVMSMIEAGDRVVICCGSGNNGGDGYALARHLHNRGVRPRIVAVGTPREGTDAAINGEICRRMAIPILDAEQHRVVDCHGDLFVDALFGTGLDRPISGEAAEIIALMNAGGAPIVAVDVPSGLDCNSGEPLGATVVATRTVTFVGWKQGFLAPAAHRHLGEVAVVDIGAPIDLYEKHGTPMGV